jgi:type I site-specific restriction endonuclease
MGLRTGASLTRITETKQERQKEIIMGTNVPKKNRTDQAVADQSLIDGLNKHAAQIPSIFTAGATVTSKDIIATLQTRIDMAKTAQSTRATWQTAVAAEKAERAKTQTLVSALRQSLLVSFAGQVDVLSDFGLTARKTPVVSPETRVAAAKQAKATREARHTMGTKQKAAIKGTVAPTAPATAAPAPTPVATPPAPPTHVA